MAATFTPQLANPDPNANPTTVASLVTLLNSLFLTGNVAGGPFTPPVISSTTPAVGDQDKIWAKVDGNGRPVGIFIFYSGNWRQFYTGNTSELRMFSGNPSTFFDGTGLGLIGLAWDGWAICNGNNGTTNWSDQFPVFGRMDNTPISGYSSGWQSDITGGATKTGGAATYAIKNTDLPSMKVFVTGANYSAGAATGIPRVLVEGDHGATIKTDANAIASFGADPNAAPPVPQTVVPTIPPYKVCALCQFVGYT
jgi:hypothetical protein